MSDRYLIVETHLSCVPRELDFLFSYQCRYFYGGEYKSELKPNNCRGL